VKRVELSKDIIYGACNETGYLSITDFPLIILVGLTGSGKTTLCKLFESQKNLYILPERRELTDKIIIPFFDQRGNADNYSREERFEFSRQYRKLNPGGMAFILTQMHFRLANGKDILVFDGLRGENEILYAVNELKNSIFIFLDTKDSVRIRRLIKRRDHFDKSRNEMNEFDLEQLSEFFSTEEINEIREDIIYGRLEEKELIEKTQIVKAERNNYSPEKSKEILLRTAKERTFIYDTSLLEPVTIFSLVQNQVIDLIRVRI
jgi:shikimate kinase